MRKKVIFGLLLLVSLIIIISVPLIFAQDFGPFSPFTDVYTNTPEYNPYGSPISPFSVFSGTTTLTQILYSDWFSGLLSFLIFFTIYLFLLRNFFKEVAVILALLLAIASAAGILIFYGPFIPLIGIWGVVILAAGALFGLFRNFKGYGKYLPITLLLVAIAWFLFRSYICGLTWIPYQLCPVMDAIAAIIVLIAGFYFIYKSTRYLFNLLRGGGTGTDGGQERITGTDPPRVNFRARPGTIARGQSSTLLWSTRRAKRVQITGIGNVATSGTYPVMPNSSTVYRLIAVGDGGSAEAAVVVNVSDSGTGGGGGAIQRNRATYDLQQKYRDYYMRIWNRGLTNHQRERILQAMKVIESQLNSQGAGLPKGAQKKPRQIYHDLKRSKLI